jgi:hypothetical protein
VCGSAGLGNAAQTGDANDICCTAIVNVSGRDVAVGRDSALCPCLLALLPCLKLHAFKSLLPLTHWQVSPPLNCLGCPAGSVWHGSGQHAWSGTAAE